MNNDELKKKIEETRKEIEQAEEKIKLEKELAELEGKDKIPKKLLKSLSIAKKMFIKVAEKLEERPTPNKQKKRKIRSMKK